MVLVFDSIVRVIPAHICNDFPKLLTCGKIVIEIIESDGPVRFREVTLHNSTGLTHKH